MNRAKGNALIFITAFFWSLGGLLYRMVDLNAVLIAGVTCMIAYVIMGIYRKSMRISLTKTAALAGFCSCMTNITFILANQMTSAANAIVLQYASPIFCLLYECLYYRRRPAWKQMAVIGMAFGGLILFFFGKLDQGAMLGNLFAIISGIFFGGVFFLNTLPQARPSDSTQFAYLLQIAISLPLLGQLSSLNQEGMLGLALIGVLQMGFAGITFAIGIRHTDSISANLIGILETIMSPLWVFLAYGEVPGTYAFLGAAVLLGAVCINIVINAEPKAKQKEADLSDTKA
ncbi:DMT family transporter [Massilicoli timonensis]|uniref:DMT family transporter n=1 Tax=Massilicoli timonensis TaxID=2015901 RepID=A0ABT1SLI7_9FIRM|nr:DMT family transporter [Massilicoli timonensis]MCQ5122084.1 DMT family transporter [Massilicoli timonensis]